MTRVHPPPAAAGDPQPPGDPRPSPRLAGITPSAPFGIGWGWWAAGAAIIFALILGAALILGDTPQPTSSVGAAAIVAEPAAYEGDRVVVSGRIDELLTDRVVAMGSDLAEDDLLVLLQPTAFVGGYGIGAPMAAPLPGGEAYEPGDVIQVTGTVRDFERDQMADELGLVLNEELFNAWEGAPALVAERLEVATVGRLDEDRTSQSE